MEVGNSGVIKGLNGDVTGPVGRRLSDLGFLAHTNVEVLRRSPWGDPTVYRVRGYDICLRSDQAKRIDVMEDSNVVS